MGEEDVEEKYFKYFVSEPLFFSYNMGNFNFDQIVGVKNNYDESGDEKNTSNDLLGWNNKHSTN